MLSVRGGSSPSDSASPQGLRRLVLVWHTHGGVAQGADDKMESFLLAETFKYLYLLQQPINSRGAGGVAPLIDLSKVVMSTEAHPFPICTGCGGPELALSVPASVGRGGVGVL